MIHYLLDVLLYVFLRVWSSFCSVKALKKHINHLESERETLEDKVKQAEEMADRAAIRASESEARGAKVRHCMTTPPKNHTLQLMHA